MNYTLIDLMQDEGLRLERRGLDWWCSCPFHRDDTPSLRVSEKERGFVWYCFSCKRGGGPVHFLAEHRNIPVHEARRLWSELSGEAPPEEGRVLLTRAVESAALKGGHPYLRDRGISAETAARYGIGFVDDYYEFLRVNGLDEQGAAYLGLFDFSNSIIYPFYDSEGVYKVAARRVDRKDYKTSPQGAKYYRDGLWGLQRLRGDEAWIFEGYHDAMVASQAGYPALAAAGTNMTQSMWEELRSRGVSRAVFVPDGDEGGRGWLERLAEGAPPDMPVSVVALETGDPDDAILAGADLRGMVQTPFQWFARRKMSRAQDLPSRISAVKSLSKAFKRMPRPDRSLSREWFESEFGSSEALDFLQVDVEFDVDAERVVVANCLFSKNIRLETVQELSEGDFSSKQNRNAFKFLREREATPQMVQVELGLDYSSYADLVNYRFYIDKVAEVGRSAKVSRLLSAADPRDVGGLIEDLYRTADNVKVMEGDDAVRRVVDTVNAKAAAPAMPGLPIPGFPTLEKVLLGWQPGKLILVSGNSGHGKTTLACNFLDGVVDLAQSLFVTLEMTEDEITTKLLCVRSGVPSNKLVTGSMEQFEYDSFIKAAKEYRTGRFTVAYGIHDLYRLVGLVKAHAMKRKVRFVVIDYAQLITIQGSREERWEQLATVTHTLKNQLCPLGVTVVALTQLKRSALNSDVPDAADQAGAYAMLADADAALTLRKVDPNDTKDGSNFLVSVSKNRFGMDEVQIPCKFDRVTQRIREVS